METIPDNQIDPSVDLNNSPINQAASPNAQIKKQHHGRSVCLIIFAVAIALFLSIIAVIFFLFSKITNSLDDVRIEARDSKRTSDIRQLQRGIKLYDAENDKYPKTLDDLKNIEHLTMDKYEYQLQGTDNYQLCFYLEIGIQGFKKGYNCVEKDVSF